MHKIKKLIVINHQDCGAAKMMNSKKFFDNTIETEIHKKSFMQIKNGFEKVKDFAIKKFIEFII